MLNKLELGTLVITLWPNIYSFCYNLNKISKKIYLELQLLLNLFIVFKKVNIKG